MGSKDKGKRESKKPAKKQPKADPARKREGQGPATYTPVRKIEDL